MLQLALAVTGIHTGRLLHDAVPSRIRAGVSSGAGTFSWMLFLPFSLGFGALARSHGALAAAGGDETPGGDPRPRLTPPRDDLTCRDLVRLVSDFLDGDLPPDWRAASMLTCAPATAAPPTWSRSSRPSHCSNRSRRP